MCFPRMNEGFEAQLKLYEAMGCEVDSTSALYKQYLLQKARGEYPGWWAPPEGGRAFLLLLHPTLSPHAGVTDSQLLPLPLLFQGHGYFAVRSLILDPLFRNPQNCNTFLPNSLPWTPAPLLQDNRTRFSIGAGSAGEDLAFS